MNITKFDRYDQKPLLECYKLKYISLYSIVLFCVSIYFNSILLYIIIKNKFLRTSLNLFIVSISILNLFATFFEFPIVAISNFYCKWPFKKIGCYLSGIIMYSIACASTYLMMAISIERINFIRHPYKVKKVDQKFDYGVIILCIFAGIFWAILPVMGWSYYSLEGVMTTCSVEWNEHTFNVQSYNFTIFILTFIMPLIVITISNLKIIYWLKESRNNYYFQNSQFIKKRVKKERHVTTVTVVLICGFILCWAPYAIVCILRMTSLSVSPLAATLPSLFAKISLPWNAIFYLFTHRDINRKFQKIFAFNSIK